MKRKTVIVHRPNGYGGPFAQSGRVLGVNKKTGLLWVKFGGVDPNQTKLFALSDLLKEWP